MAMKKKQSAKIHLQFCYHKFPLLGWQSASIPYVHELWLYPCCNPRLEYSLKDANCWVNDVRVTAIMEQEISLMQSRNERHLTA